MPLRELDISNSVDLKAQLKVLVSAYACNPYQGSEAGVGWGWINAIALHHHVWVITAELNKPDIEREVALHPDRYRNIHFYYAPRRRWLKLERLWPPSYLWTYLLWERAAYRTAYNLYKELNFDLVHHLTYVGFRIPGFLWKLDIPFVWGPIGGLENTPWRFLPGLGFTGCIYYAGRNLLNTLHKKFLPAPKKAFRKARGGIIAATEGIRSEIKHWYGEESQVICEIGPPAVIAEAHSMRGTGETLKISWSGQHLPGKALHLLLHALSRMPSVTKWHLDILGQGPLTGVWQRLAQKLGVHQNCKWHGHIARSEAIKVVHQSHIFVITSLKDLTSTVLLEALSQGVPVVCPDHCGFSNVVSEDCGVRVPIVSPRQFESDLMVAIKGLADDEQKRRHLADGALQRIRDFSWEKKAEQVDAIYERTVNRPDE